jgi:hypothetical protein
MRANPENQSIYPNRQRTGFLVCALCFLHACGRFLEIETFGIRLRNGFEANGIGSETSLNRLRSGLEEALNRNRTLLGFRVWSAKADFRLSPENPIFSLSLHPCPNGYGLAAGWQLVIRNKFVTKEPGRCM